MFLEIKPLPFGRHLYPEKDEVCRRASTRIITQMFKPDLFLLLDNKSRCWVAYRYTDFCKH